MALRLSILLNQNPPDNKKNEQVKSLLGYIKKYIWIIAWQKENRAFTCVMNTRYVRRRKKTGKKKRIWRVHQHKDDNITATKRGISDIMRYAALYFVKVFDKLLKCVSAYDILNLIYSFKQYGVWYMKLGIVINRPFFISPHKVIKTPKTLTAQGIRRFFRFI